MNAEEALLPLHDLDDLLDELEPARRARLEREAVEVYAHGPSPNIRVTNRHFAGIAHYSATFSISDD